MSVEEKVGRRVRALIEEGGRLSHGNEYGNVRNDQHQQQCSAWLPAAQNAVHLVCPVPTNPYRVKADAICGKTWGFGVNSGVGTMTLLLTRLLADAEAGLLVSVADAARAEVFDDFLDHGEHYLRAERKNEAGVVVGVVFEDTVRRLCNKYGIKQADVNLDALISELAKTDVLSGTKAKRARAAAHVRTKATHAQWHEFELDDVREALALTRELVSSKLEA